MEPFKILSRSNFLQLKKQPNYFVHISTWTKSIHSPRKVNNGVCCHSVMSHFSQLHEYRDARGEVAVNQCNLILLSAVLAWCDAAVSLSCHQLFGLWTVHRRDNAKLNW